MLIPTFTQLKREVHWPYRRLCCVLEVPYGSFRRWKRRLEQGEPVRIPPGPKKVAPLSLDELRGAVCESHGDHRIAMSMAVAGLAAAGDTVVRDTGWIDTSFPGFERIFRHAAYS